MFDKRAQALAALQAAELQTGVTPVVAANLGARAAPVPVPADSVPVTDLAASVIEPYESAALPLPPAIFRLFPGGQITPGAVISVLGSRWLQYQILSAGSQSGTWLAVVGASDSNAVALAQAGLSLERVAFVPDPGINAGVVCAALLEAMCILIGSDIKLSGAEQRRLAARARERGTVIVSESPWPGAHLSFRVLSREWSGADRGEGWLQHSLLAVERIGRGSAAKPIRFEVELAPR